MGLRFGMSPSPRKGTCICWFSHLSMLSFKSMHICTCAHITSSVHEALYSPLSFPPCDFSAAARQGCQRAGSRWIVQPVDQVQHVVELGVEALDPAHWTLRGPMLQRQTTPGRTCPLEHTSFSLGRASCHKDRRAASTRAQTKESPYWVHVGSAELNPKPPADSSTMHVLMPLALGTRAK